MSHTSHFREEIDTSDLQPSNSGLIGSPTQPRIPFRRETSWSAPSTRNRDVSPVDDYNVASANRHGSNRNGHEDTGPGAYLNPNRLSIPRAYSPVSTDSGGANDLYDQSLKSRHSEDAGQRNNDETWTTRHHHQDSYKGNRQAEVPLITRSHHHDPETCPTRESVLKRGWTWFTVTIIVFGFFSWAFSGIFLGLAIAKPRWGFRIGTVGHVSYDTATLLSALLSKLVELTFATTFVVTLGQILSRKAVANSRKGPRHTGISLAEMNMKLWILQPGSLVTHWSGVKHVITTLLGITALAAAVSAAFYTTAAEALVSPKLKFGRNETMQMHGQIHANFGNVKYMGETCSNAIPTEEDPIDGGSTCMQIDFAGNGFRNLLSWSSAWQARQSTSNDAKALESGPRPPPTAILYDNTTAHGLWITPSGEDVTADSDKYGRFVQNTTMVMPHANVFHAARDPSNRLLQPDDLQGAGEYYIQAAVPVPGVNALCVGVSESEIMPLISNGTAGVTPGNWTNTTTTPIDELFSWSHTPDNTSTYPHPWFGKLPIEYNTVGNTTNTYGIPWVYFIAKPPKNVTTQDYIVCGVRSFQYSDCSTSLFASSSGSDLSVHCGKSSRNWKSFEEAGGPKNPPTMVDNNKDMMYVLQDWIRAVSLTSGISDADTSLARQVTQMIPPYDNNTATKLSPTMPSIGEALCVLAGYPLLRASDAAPFVNYWDYQGFADNILTDPVLGNFSALVSYKDYQSGGDAEWKSIFYVVLSIIFVLNTFCLLLLLYYFSRYGEVTDFTDPQNLFTLAINSPPSRMVSGACGSGPSSEMLGKKWWVDKKMLEGNAMTPHPQAAATGALDTDTNAHYYVRYSEEEPLLVSGAASSSSSFKDRLIWFLSGPLQDRSGPKTRTGPSGHATEFDSGNNGPTGEYVRLEDR